MRDLEKQFIILTGIPGSGKTEYGKHLAKEYSFDFLETDEHCVFLNILVQAARSDSNFIAWCLNMCHRVVVEWGFHPDFYMQDVLALKRQGAKLIWFTGQEAMIYPAYVKAKKGDALALEARKLQMVRIKEHDLPTSFEDCRVITTTSDIGFRRFEEFDEEVIFH